MAGNARQKRINKADLENGDAATFQSRRAHAYKIGPHKLIRGDCLKSLKAFAADSIDIVVTSPPYNIGLSYRSYDDRREEEDYLQWMVQVAKALKRVLRKDGSFFLNISGSSSYPWLPFELAVRLRPLFVLQNHISWVKSVSIGEDTLGHFKPINSNRYLNHNHEHLFHFTHEGTVPLKRLQIGVPFKDKSNIKRRSHSHDLRCRGNVWFVPYKTIRSKEGKYNHPGTFPLELPTMCIRLHGKKKPTVLDPFCGVGTSLVAAIAEDGIATGIEIDPAYVAISKERIIEAVTPKVKNNN